MAAQAHFCCMPTQCSAAAMHWTSGKARCFNQQTSVHVRDNYQAGLADRPSPYPAMLHASQEGLRGADSMTGYRLAGVCLVRQARCIVLPLCAANTVSIACMCAHLHCCCCHAFVSSLLLCIGAASLKVTVPLMVERWCFGTTLPSTSPHPFSAATEPNKMVVPWSWASKHRCVCLTIAAQTMASQVSANTQILCRKWHDPVLKSLAKLRAV